MEGQFHIVEQLTKDFGETERAGKLGNVISRRQDRKIVK
jgi:hypothetical protein